MIKICSKCKLELLLECFGKLLSSKDGLNYACKICENKRNGNFRKIKEKELGMTLAKYTYSQNKEYFHNIKINLTDEQKQIRSVKEQIRYELNKEEIAKKNKIRRNTPEYRIKANEKKRERRKFDIIFKLRQDVSRSIAKALKLEDSSKFGESITNYLPYTIEQLKIYIEFLFEPWMTWDNHGSYKIGGERKWNIDHIIPQSLLPYDSMEHPNFKKCWALENLMPLDAFENISKSNKLKKIKS